MILRQYACVQSMLTQTPVSSIPRSDRIFSGGVVIDGGRISEVFEGSREGEDWRGLCLAPGIIDIGVKVGEPGERHKESFRTAGAAAAAGGVTTIVTRPDTLRRSTPPKPSSSSCAAASRSAPFTSCPWPPSPRAVRGGR